jgi:CheY-like chemotaxis protein
VIDNLLLNARQAMSGGGRVTISASNRSLEGEPVRVLAPGRYVEVQIADEGGGIPPDIQHRVFDPFFATKGAGSGLGLAIAHSIVTQHRGSIDFESVAERGTTFRLLLPAAAAAPAEVRAPSEPAPRHGGGRILVMDDQPYVLEVADAALTELGYIVETVSGGAEAVSAFQRAQAEARPFDLAILDLTIAGGMGGVETLARLRDLAPEIRAIASSGYASDAVLADPEAFGFNGTLAKPYTIAELADTVAATLGGASGE